MRIITNKTQQDIYKRIVEVITTLAATDSEDHNYAIADMWHIAGLVGGRHMVDALEGKNYYSRPMRERVGDSPCDSIDVLDGIMDCQWK